MKSQNNSDVNADDELIDKVNELFDNVNIKSTQGIWVVRKGQFIVNMLNRIGVSREDIGRFLHGLNDEEFEEIEHEYRKYLLSVIHPTLTKHRSKSIKKFSDELKLVGKSK